MDENSLEALYRDFCSQESDISEHLPVLRELAFGRVLELGVRFGKSTVALLLAAEELVSVDLERCEDLRIVEDAYARANRRARWRMVIGDDLSVEIEGEFDVAFVDSNHTYVHLSQELKRFCPIVKSRIILHDTVSCGAYDVLRGMEGIGRAINEFLKEHAEWFVERNYTNQNGLMVLAKR